ncbi:tripartite tricarboxylate transporter substrate binding protein [Ramlibacter tataouinensis]|uniref:tripartite tricarboxylate transporter substrate binding protein n=1 Tax=Ramlibacter tataouinensis TaxID=94132 RepID=UPI0022F3C8C6|nr:tripartite tricarboxylate transporter substrate binding protein [Ramlibacter tataouinensis]WBY01510.1 tripartite tricarboxylate transporter substrate binding protein [Ramlibacter tataouinensis]
MQRRLFTTAVAAAALVAVAGPASASSWPDKPIKLIVPYSAGGVTDQMGRALAEFASKRLGQAVVIENKTGANGTLGAVQMRTTDPAGYTLTMIPIGVFRMPHITGAQYDPLKDLTYISSVAGFNYYIAVNAASPWKTMAELIDYAKKKQGPVSYGTPGAYSSQHLGMAQLGTHVGADWVHIPFKGDADAMTALLGNHVQAVVSASSILPYVETGRMRVLAALGDKRSDELPNVPTLKELGYPVVHTSPIGIAGPKGMDPAVVKKLDATFRDVLNDPEFQAALKKFGLSSLYMDQASYAKYARDIYLGEKDALKAMVANVK